MSWTFLSNHGHVIVQLARNPELKISELADLVGITERRVAAILRELQEAGYILVAKEGRRNYYQVNLDGRLRHDAESAKSVGDLIAVLR
jgi:DNA-binding MarR family transcriptional regulator